jgi:hypothetical protein
MDASSAEDLTAFASALLDISDGLSIDVISGPLPISIALRTGATIELWSGLRPLSKIRPPEPRQKARDRRVNEVSERTRRTVLKLRVEVEFLLFISQTGMNSAQASRLPVGSFRYQSDNDGYRIRRAYKGRRQGEVEFSIYKEYRPLFERYLAWRAHFAEFFEGDLLFPHTRNSRSA